MRIRVLHNTDYVALPDLARASGYHGGWVDGGRAYGLGDHDVVWRFAIGSSTVSQAGSKFAMPAPAVLDRGLLYVPVSGLRPLFEKDVMITGDAANLTVVPRSVIHETGADGTNLNFRDAPGSAARHEKIIQIAQSLLGTRYEFGAAPYASSGAFDCSSFTQYAFNKVGVQLPRSAREQAKLGRPAARDTLHPGDLLFFNVPGRFKSQAAAGHVGIYMGGGKMIHAMPGPRGGVQISDLGQAHWKRNFLYAKRVLAQKTAS